MNSSDIWRKWCIAFATLIHFKEVSTFTQCEYSLQKVNHVRYCPTDVVSWNKAAERMDCQSIEQNCSSGLNSQRYVFQYHCVVNGWLNSTLEVCAFNRTIFGFCTEFNTKGAMIQDNYAADCTSHDPPCPKSYNSAEAYKYPTCYHLARLSAASSTARWIGSTAMIFASIIVGVVIWPVWNAFP